MKQDQLSGAQVILTTNHSEINSGDGYSLALDTGALAGNAVYNISLTTPAAGTLKRIHLSDIKLFSTANAMTLAIHEESVSSGGTPFAMRNRFRSDNPKISGLIVKKGVTAALAGENLMTPVLGGAFVQPAGDTIQVISSDAADTTQSVTVYGTVTGATTTVTSETIKLTGTTAKDSISSTFQKILGIELSGVCAGTVTVRKKTGPVTIKAIAPGGLSSGLAVVTNIQTRDTIVRHDADGASTKSIGIIGTAPNGSALTSVDELNGTTEENHNADIFRTVTKILVGDVEVGVTCWILRPEVILDAIPAGALGFPSVREGGTSGEDYGFILMPDTEYFLSVTNGPTTTSTGYVNIFFHSDTVPYLP